MTSFTIKFGDPNEAFGPLSSHAHTPFVIHDEEWLSVAEYMNYNAKYRPFRSRMMHLAVLERALLAKLSQHPNIRELLLSTGHAHLRQFQDHGDWNDALVGPLLMLIRHTFLETQGYADLFLLPSSLRTGSNQDDGYETYFQLWLDKLDEKIYGHYRRYFEKQLAQRQRQDLLRRIGFIVISDTHQEAMDGLLDWYIWEWDDHAQKSIGLRDDEHLEMIMSRMLCEQFIALDLTQGEKAELDMRMFLEHTDLINYRDFWQNQYSEWTCYREATERFSTDHWLCVQVGRDLVTSVYNTDRLAKWLQLQLDRKAALANDASLETLQTLTPLYVGDLIPDYSEALPSAIASTWSLKQQILAVKTYLEDELRCMEWQHRRNGTFQEEIAAELLIQHFSIELYAQGVLENIYTLRDIRLTLQSIRRQFDVQDIREIAKLICVELMQEVRANFLDDWFPYPTAIVSAQELMAHFQEMVDTYRKERAQLIEPLLVQQSMVTTKW